MALTTRNSNMVAASVSDPVDAHTHAMDPYPAYYTNMYHTPGREMSHSNPFSDSDMRISPSQPQFSPMSSTASVVHGSVPVFSSVAFERVSMHAPDGTHIERIRGIMVGNASLRHMHERLQSAYDAQAHLQSDLQELSELLQHVCDVVVELEQRKSDLQRAYKQLEAHQEHIVRVGDALGKHVSSLSSAWENDHAILIRMQGEHGQNVAGIQKLQQEVHDISMHIASMNLRLQGLPEIVTELRNTQEQWVKEVVALRLNKLEVKALREEVEQMQNAIKTLLGDTSAIKKTIAKVPTDCGSRAPNTTEPAPSLKAFQATQLELETTKQRYDAQLDSLIEEIRKINSRHTQEKREQNARIEGLEKQLADAIAHMRNVAPTPPPHPSAPLSQAEQHLLTKQEEHNRCIQAHTKQL